MKNIAIFVSGRGSNMEAIINASKEQKINAKVVLVISNNPDAFALQIAKNHKIETCVINHKFYEERSLYDSALLKTLDLYHIDLICLAGFMRVLSPYFFTYNKTPIINIHPSLLPSFKGANALEEAFNYGVKVTGCTVHHVVEEIDSGKIIIQKSLDISQMDNFLQLKERMHKLEHKAYIEAINQLIPKE